jgi:PIN domain nuclease of toxin-antitoxin system
MRILLDTHFFIWWDSEPQLLSPHARKLCEDAENTLVLSVVSIWEMQIKQQLGKMKLRLPISELIADQQKENGIEILPVNLPHVLALEKLPLHHKDPFDRLLIAQANAEGIEILSVDAIFRKYDVKLSN